MDKRLKELSNRIRLAVYLHPKDTIELDNGFSLKTDIDKYSAFISLFKGDKQLSSMQVARFSDRTFDQFAKTLEEQGYFGETAVVDEDSDGVYAGLGSVLADIDKEDE